MNEDDADMRGCSVVVVDDDRLLLSLLVEGLQGWGFDAIGFYSTAEAEAHLQSQPCEVLISDQAMTQRDEGEGLLRRALEAGWCQSGLLISGYPRHDQSNERLPDGVRFLRKPFRLPELVEACDALTGGGST